MAKGPAPEKESARARWLMPLLRLAAAVALLFVVALISILTSWTLGWMNHHTFPAVLMRFKSVRNFDTLFVHLHMPAPWLVLGHYPSDASETYMHVLRETRISTLVGHL